MLQIDLPNDLRDYVLDYQFQIKREKGIKQYSQQQAIYAIIKEHKELKEELTNLKGLLSFRSKHPET